MLQLQAFLVIPDSQLCQLEDSFGLIYKDLLGLSFEMKILEMNFFRYFILMNSVQIMWRIMNYGALYKQLKRNQNVEISLLLHAQPVTDSACIFWELHILVVIAEK